LLTLFNLATGSEDREWRLVVHELTKENFQARVAQNLTEITAHLKGDSTVSAMRPQNMFHKHIRI
jgi:uncharacterized protein YgfB (UPF0149 family)